MMCAPDHYGVDYVINPWMAGNCGQTDASLALKQWQGLKTIVEQFADVALIPPQPKLPDMVFTANAGLVLGDTVVVSRFRNVERQGEEPHFKGWFATQGFACVEWPMEVPFEGAGDALWDRALPILWIGSGFRSDVAAPPLLEKVYGRRVIPLKLVDPRFYHLDTALCPLSGGYLMYYPAAFASESLELLKEMIPEDKHIPVNDQDAANFSCNAVELDGHVIMNHASPDLCRRLAQAGFKAILTPLTEFLKAGGTAKCLTLKLVEQI